MSTTATLIYNPLLEDESNKRGWDKQTIEYVLKNTSRIKSSISSYAKSMNKILTAADIEDCYSDVLINFYESNDYDINIATERAGEKAREKEIGQRGTGQKSKEPKGKESKGVGIISLEAYVYKITKFVVMRYVTDRLSIESKEMSNITYNKEEREEFNLLDTIPDTSDTESKYDKLQYDLDTICKQYESHRYKYLIDIFQLWFIKLLLIKYNKEDYYKDILETIGTKKADLNYLKNAIKHSEVMFDIAKAVSIAGVEQAIKVLGNYTYAADRLERLVEIV